MENKSVEMSIEDRIKERKEKAKVRATVTKDKICELYDMLSFTRITFNKIEVKYAGSGDSGAVEDMDFMKDDKIQESRPQTVDDLIAETITDIKRRRKWN